MLAPIPADEIAVSHLPTGEGLKNGDEGAVVDAIYRDRGWVAVEFVRNAKTVAVTDVPTRAYASSGKRPPLHLPPSECSARLADLLRTSLCSVAIDSPS